MAEQSKKDQANMGMDLVSELRDLAARSDLRADQDMLRRAAVYIQENLNASDLPVPEYEISMIGGNCPVQAEGTIGGKPFYFRARGSGWSVGVGHEPVCRPEWRHEDVYGASFEAGWMDEDEARALIDLALASYAAGRPGKSL